MRETQVSMTDLRQNLAGLINRAAYSGERIVLVSHGEPKAVIISIAELRQLEQRGAGSNAQGLQYQQALAAADVIREEASHWQETHNVKAEDSVETLRLLREERDDDDLAGLC